MKARTLIPLLLALTTTPVMARDAETGVFVGVGITIAQVGAEERRAWQERWERANPDERVRLRQEMQDRMRMPGFPDSGRFGTGYERRFEDGHGDDRGAREFPPAPRPPRDSRGR